MSTPDNQFSKWTDVSIPWSAAMPSTPAATRGRIVSAQSFSFQFELAAAWAACGTFERVAFSYLALSSLLIVAFAQNLAHPWRILAIRAVVTTTVLVLCWVETRIASPSRLRANAASPRRFVAHFFHFWRHWYPHLLFLFCFEELGRLVHLISPGWQDARLIAFDFWLTGVHPSIWLEQFATPVRNDFFQFAYLTYFVYLVLLGGILYRRRELPAYWSVMTYSMVAYSFGYIIAILFPIESPWFSLAGAWHGPLNGGPFTALISGIEHFGRVRGAAFPSEHVAGSFAALWGAWRHRRWLFWTMLPLVLCMCVSTIYGRYHYVADIFGGMITGTLGYVVGRWLVARVAVPQSSNLSKKFFPVVADSRMSRYSR